MIGVDYNLLLSWLANTGEVRLPILAPQVRVTKRMADTSLAKADDRKRTFSQIKA